MRILEINSLPSEQWIDRDFIMLHACFQILQDCVEEEKIDTDCNYEIHKELVDEIRFLYSWWLVRKEVVFRDDDEDEVILNRLIKIRTSLWT